MTKQEQIAVRNLFDMLSLSMRAQQASQEAFLELVTMLQRGVTLTSDELATRCELVSAQLADLARNAEAIDAARHGFRMFGTKSR